MTVFNTKINLVDDKVRQASGQTLVLSGNTIIAGTGNLSYLVHPTITGDTQIVDKRYVDLQLSGGSIYNLDSPSTVTVGGIIAGSILTGKSSNQLLKEILVPYLVPSFSTFTNSQGVAVEVGSVISGSKSFAWTFANSINVSANTMCLRDVSAGVTIATNISTTSPQSATICTKTFTSCSETQIWCGSAKNTCGSQFNSSSYTVTSYLPYYWGKCTCPGVAGANRPTPTCAMIIGGTKVLANSSGTLSINFNSTADDYLWFAIPSSVVNKTCWCVTSLNNGSIGGGVSPACNLFPTPDLTTGVTTVCWSNQTYCVYISNKQTCVITSMSLS